MGVELFNQENQALGRGFLERYFFSNWRLPREKRNLNFDQLELIVSPLCSHACAYCYINRFKDELYPIELRDEEKIVEHAALVIDWLIQEGLSPNIDFFSGAPLEQRVCFEVLEMMLERYAQAEARVRPERIVVPTPYSFLLSEELTERVERLIAGFAELGIRFALSASFDGKYCEQFRPLAYAKEGPLSDGYLFRAEPDARDDAFYDKCFAFNKKHGFGFHPMLYARAMPYWKENFLWFQENFKKHGIPPFALYLLEVRNQNWTEEQIWLLGEFIDFIIRWAWKLCKEDLSQFESFLFKKRGFNILSSPLTTTGRGLGCSKQSMLYLRLGDLAIVPCHREMYKGEEYGFLRLKRERGKVECEIEITNPEKLIGYYSFDADAWPYCETCVLKYSCSHGCTGSQLENMGDPFTPIPTVCKMEHYKVYREVRTFQELGIYEAITRRLSPQVKAGLDLLLELGSRAEPNEIRFRS